MPHKMAAGSDRALETAGACARGLTRVVRRAWIADGLVAGAIGSLIAAVVSLPGRPAFAWVAGFSAAALALWRGRGKRTARGAARLLERARPDCRNVVITAEELLRHPKRASPWIRARVLADAVRLVDAIPPAAAVPLARPMALFLAAAAGGLLITGLSHRASDAIRGVVSRAARAGTPSASAPLKIVATVIPPVYTGLSLREETNPDRLDALQGSRIRLAITGRPDPWQVRFGAKPLAVTHGDRETIAELIVSESGYFAIEPRDGPAESPDRRLLPVAVTPDRAPVIRIDAPGRDLVLADVRAPVPFGATASDDFGLQSFELRYTKVSGTGEQFEFEEGSLPLGVSRASDIMWKGSAQIAVAALKLEPGDALVYRAVARDRRPGDEGLASSDTFFIEIAGPGQVAIEGFEMPPDQERYALSQQMIVLKIQRLRARERTLRRAALEEATAAIAAEQRAVRANFVFLMGGHVEDEEDEAARSPEIAEGRLQNASRKEINAAISYMSRAEQGLTAVDAGAALPPARAAAEALQRAFGRHRYILRSVPVRSRVDPARRLTGELSDAAGWRRELQPATLDRETREARALLPKMLELAATMRRGGPIDRGAFTALAEQALAIHPGAAPWPDVARRLGLVGESVAAGRPGTPWTSWTSETSEISEAIAPVIARAQRGARLPAQAGTRAPGALLGAWAEEARR